MKRALGKLLLALVSPVVVLGGLEGALGLLGTGPLIDDTTFQHAVRYRNCQFQWNAAEQFCDAARLEVPRPHTIVALGGSSVAGYPPRETIPFAVQLQGLLDRERPGQYRVFNRGHACKDTIFVRECGFAALRARPDWLVIYAGHNDFASWGLVSPKRWITLEENAWIYDLDVSLARSRLYSALVRALRPAEPVQSLVIAPFPEDTVAPRAITLAKTEENLTRLIEAATAAGTKVMLLTIVSNLNEYPVRREDWEEGPERLAGQFPGLATWQRHYRAGIDAERAGQHGRALAEFKLARDAYQQGRAHSELNERLRTLAGRHPEVRFIDFEAELDALSQEEGIGCGFFGSESYCDQFHPNTRTHGLIAEALLRELRASE
jgi:lysophospholipase L1-like esterase